jgi:hypothetical protein
MSESRQLSETEILVIRQTSTTRADIVRKMRRRLRLSQMQAAAALDAAIRQRHPDRPGMVALNTYRGLERAEYDPSESVLQGLADAWTGGDIGLLYPA